MKSQSVRQTFLDFFKSKGHTIVPSAPMVIKNDPTLMFTNAGMNQFKDIFLGNNESKYSRIADTQKCLRVSGKHNDLEEVGHDTYHHTMFEMLGNWSFGDYFKKEAIAYAHEFITHVVGLPIAYVTIFKGSDVMPKDLESKKIWNSLGITDVREEGMEDVFWGPTGSNGPCGPTTEIYAKTSEGKDVEVWNIVFNEFLCSSSREDLLAGKAALP